MKTPRIPTLAIALLLWSTGGQAAGGDYFTNPPGCQWSSLMFTNAAAYCLAVTPSGYVLAGECQGPPGETAQTAVVLALGSDGTPGHAYFFPGVESGGGHRDSGAFSIAPSCDTGGEWDGYLVTGYRSLLFEEDGRQWDNPALWAAKLDLGFYTVWERTLEGPNGVGRWGNAVIWDHAGFYERAGALFGGAQTCDLGQTEAEFHGGGGFTQGLATRLYNDGEVHWEILEGDPGRGWMGIVFSVAPLQSGGYVFGTRRGICLTSSGLVPQWTVQETNRFYSVKPTADGGCIGVGTQLELERELGGHGEITWTDIVLTKVDAGGNVEWTRTFGLPKENDIGHCVTTAPDGYVLVGEAEKPGIGGSAWTDALVIRVSPSGEVRWDVRLGGTNDAKAYSVVPLQSHFLVAGEALGKMWLFELRGNLTVPIPQFTYSPGSPVFVGQEITFDASASSAPGGSVIEYAWDFGDGETATGPVVRHAYQTPKNYPVSLKVMSNDGVVRSATQTVAVINWAVQWERFPGNTLNAITEAQDGGFLLAGSIYKAWGNNDDLWLLKTDSRGRLKWARSYYPPDLGLPANCGGGSDHGYAVIRAPSEGYMVAGSVWCYDTRPDGWLLKVNEEGEFEWTKSYRWQGDTTDSFLSVAPLADGGYILSGWTWEHVIGDPVWPWVVRVDAGGNELDNWKIPLTWKGYRGEWVIPLADSSGYVFACGSGAPDGQSSILITKVRTNQSLEWTTSLPSSRDYMPYGGRWVSATSDGGFVVAGTARMEFASGEFRTRSCLIKLNATGNPLWTDFWPSASARVRSYGLGAVATPEGGFVVVGACEDGTSLTGYLDLAMRATDAEGQTRWVQTIGVTNLDESGLKVLALADGSYVILGRHGDRAGDPMRGQSWLFKLAANHPPVAQIHASTNGAPIGETLTFDGSASTDRDGTVVLHEWDFGDGQTATNAIVTHSYTNSGTYVVRLTAVDDREAEGIALHTNYVAGAAVLGTGIQIGDFSLTNCPSCQQAVYSFKGAPELLDWTRALGAKVNLKGTDPSGTEKVVITFADPIPAGAGLYRLASVPWQQWPVWNAIMYEIIDPHTIRVAASFAIDSELVLVLAPTAPLPAFTAVQATSPTRLGMTIGTTPGFRYRMQRAPELRSGAWTNVPHALAEGEPCALESVVGTGSPVTVFVEPPATGNAFFRLTMESMVP